jgi:hypothetical protein
VAQDEVAADTRTSLFMALFFAPVSHRWRQLNRGLWSSPGAVLATVSGVITIVLFLAAIVQWLAQAT